MTRRSSVTVGVALVACLASGVARSDPPAAQPSPIPMPSWMPPIPSGWTPPPLPPLPPGFTLPPGFPTATPLPAPTVRPVATAPVPQLPVPQLPVPGGAVPRVEFRRTADVSFPRGGPAPRITLVEAHRDHAWYAPNGAAIVTSGGGAGSLIAGGRIVPISFADGFSATFSPDGGRVALVQARSPASVISVPDGRVLWQRPQGRECAARWASPTVLLVHDDGDGRLWRIDVSTNTVTPLGGTRRADRCWATPNGNQWIASDGVTVWVIDGTTGASSVLVTGANAIVGSPAGNRVCYSLNGDLFCQTVWPARLEHIFPNVSLSSGDAIDELGGRLLFNSQGTSYLADFATGTVFAVPAARIESGGWIALVAGGHVVATGTFAGTNLYNTDTGTKTLAAGARGFSVSPAPGRYRSVMQGRETSNGWNDLYLVDIP